MSSVSISAPAPFPAAKSNHTRQVAAVAAKLGLKARLVQENWVNWPDAVNDRVGNILLIDLIRTGQIARDSTVLYAHLGGQPALNAYSALFR